MVETTPTPPTDEALLIRCVVGAEEAGQRLDRFLAERTETGAAFLSRMRIKTLIEQGHVSVDGEARLTASASVRAGQIIELAVPPAKEAVPVAQDLPLNIVYEDAGLVVLDKPAGLVVHPAAGHAQGTLVNALMAHCGESLSGIGGVKRPGIVHRLDKDTSGLLVAAKTDAVHQGLARLFADHGQNLHLVREYLAFVWGVPARQSGRIEAALGRHAQDRERQAVVSEDVGRHAVTHWEVLEVFQRKGKPVASLIACQLETGRTHQIRVHMAHIGHPLLGDPLYGKGFKSKSAILSPPAQEALRQLGRQALHAAQLGFEHPITGEEMLFESALPADLAALLNTLRSGE
ncbi:RluA family pseudouridine synthase [Beijerinckia indica]|uniref:Pseudouridine synthase n=1 Tax=Beijerinckia indica subsp. indica (strain ATCC 9039 / DSM 1715 / NCIMB 8712) TaxID=395963 RepID=B2IDF0_BEII9|nr:RluA family pseudouridine synthase [Beijerinckia indica]ACB94002.1 pseudouridine synthase, RluA family [Beijerinckia indica subsp. indica ATCC 9039]